MLSGKQLNGLKTVRQFFPEATLSDINAGYKGVRAALDELGERESSSAHDVVRIFDSHSVGVYGGVEIR